MVTHTDMTLPQGTKEGHIACVREGHTGWLDRLLNSIDKSSQGHNWVLHQAVQVVVMDKLCNI